MPRRYVCNRLYCKLSLSRLQLYVLYKIVALNREIRESFLDFLDFQFGNREADHTAELLHTFANPLSTKTD